MPGAIPGVLVRRGNTWAVEGGAGEGWRVLREAGVGSPGRVGVGRLLETGAGVLLGLTGVVWTRGVPGGASPLRLRKRSDPGERVSRGAVLAGVAWTTWGGEGPLGRPGRQLRVARGAWRPGVLLRSEEADSGPPPRVFQGPRGHFAQTDMTSKLGLLRGDTFPPLGGGCVIGSI